MIQHLKNMFMIFQFNGTLERFAGDGIMVFFNDPIPCEDHTEKAVRMALEMRVRSKELRKEWLKKGYDLDLGIGLAAGYATLGNIGPALGAVGPVEHYGWIPGGAKLLMCLAMILGRLEIYTVLVVFMPMFWKRN